MLQTLIIGAGSIGERHLRCLLQTGRTRVSFCDVSSEVRSRIRLAYEIERDYPTLEDVNLNEYDAAVVCTPAHLHLSMAERLLDAGVAVLIEKPLSTSLEEAARFLERQDASCGVAYVMRHHPAVRAAREIIQRGTYGNAVQVVFSGGQHFPLYRPDFQRIYYARSVTGGGAMQDALTHMMNAAEWLVGPATSVTADVDRLVLQGVDVEDSVHVLTRHTRVMGSYSLNQHQAANEGRLTVHCTSGSIRIDFGDQQLLIAGKPGDDWEVVESWSLERDDLFVAQANAFLNHVSGKAEASCSVADAAQTLKVMLFALEAAATQTWRTL